VYCLPPPGRHARPSAREEGAKTWKDIGKLRTNKLSKCQQNKQHKSKQTNKLTIF